MKVIFLWRNSFCPLAHAVSSGECNTIDLEIFMLWNFRVWEFFVLKYFHGLRYPGKFLTVLLLKGVFICRVEWLRKKTLSSSQDSNMGPFYVPRFSHQEWDYAHQQYIQLAPLWLRCSFWETTRMWKRTEECCQACTVAVKIDILLDTELNFCYELPVDIRVSFSFLPKGGQNEIVWIIGGGGASTNLCAKHGGSGGMFPRENLTFY